MDRKPEPGPSWSFVVVPHGGTGTIREYVLTANALRGLRLFAGLLVCAGIALFIAVGVTLPRSIAYSRLVDENLEMKSHLQELDDRMTEVDRILLRLRLYDAQLQSLSTPRGDHGGDLPEGLFANPDPDKPAKVRAFSSNQAGAAIEVGKSHADPNEKLRIPDNTETWEEAEGDWTDASSMDLPPGLFDVDPGERDGAEWANEVSGRADAFLQQFSASEADLSRIVGDLEDVALLEKALPSTWPAHGYITSGYGWRRHPILRVWKFHAGIDIANTVGTRIYAVSEGTVSFADRDGALGRRVIVDHGFGIQSEYGHCAKLLVAVGDVVKAGQAIALMGNTGMSTGPHVHFEILVDGNPTDPAGWLPKE